MGVNNDTTTSSKVEFVVILTGTIPKELKIENVSTRRVIMHGSNALSAIIFLLNGQIPVLIKSLCMFDTDINFDHTLLNNIPNDVHSFFCLEIAANIVLVIIICSKYGFVEL